jgi:homoserine dehydrogenase
MPIVRTIADGLAGDRIDAIDAILNGTTNAVLTAIEASDCTLDAALRAAQAGGYAESDPAADLDGDDARAKLSILCALAFGLRLDPAAIGGRSAASTTAADFARARQRGATIRQLAHADYDRATATLTAWVAPTEVAGASLFGRTVGPQNAAIITCEHSGEIGIFGAGAGGEATAVAILSDVAVIARDRAAIVPPPVLTANFILQTPDFDPVEVAC